MVSIQLPVVGLASNHRNSGPPPASQNHAHASFSSAVHPTGASSSVSGSTNRQSSKRKASQTFVQGNVANALASIARMRAQPISYPSSNFCLVRPEPAGALFDLS